MAGRPSKFSQFPTFTFQPFSMQQKKLMTWWHEKSPYKSFDMVICDGSIRSGKTIAMLTSFTLWSLTNFPEGANFILAARSMGALKRNVLEPLFAILQAQGIGYKYTKGEAPCVAIGKNIYYLFGASTEASQDTLQGLTAAGAYADDAARMPRNFIEQMIGRCSYAGSKVWVNCNPESPFHYLKTDYIDKAEEKRILRLQFTLDDNLSLSEQVKDKYKRLFSGVFYKRYILGLWVMAEGLVYSMFDLDRHVVEEVPPIRTYWVGVDYGTSNATTFILCGQGIDDKFYVINEYYHSGRETNRQKSPSQYSKDFMEWLSNQYDSYGMRVKPAWIYIDPSAEGFILQMWNDGIRAITQADNAVKSGIELMASTITSDCFRVHKQCKHVLKEITSYSWDTRAQQLGEDVPVKSNDHTLDPIRYVMNGNRKLVSNFISKSR